MKKVLLMAIALALSVSATTARADDDARDYIAAPPGTFLMITYYKHIFGDKSFTDGDLTKDVNFSQNLVIFRPVYYTKLGPFVIDPQMLLPAAEVHLDGNGVGGADLSATGLADPVLLATLWFVNDTASKTWLGFTPFVTVPLGSYDKDRALNIGNNRWAFKPEIGFVKGFGDKTYLDLIAAYEFYTKNTDFGPNSVDFEQDPVLTLEAHLSYDVTKSFYVAGDYFYHWGGETKIDGDKQGNKQSNHAWQGTLGFGIAPSYQLLIQYRNDFLVKSGVKTDTFGVRFLYAF